MAHHSLGAHIKPDYIQHLINNGHFERGTLAFDIAQQAANIDIATLTPDQLEEWEQSLLPILNGATDAPIS
jgi:hypothetical protein